MNPTDWWKGLSTPRKAGLVGGIVGVVVLTAVLAFFFLRPAYVPLFTDLGKEDTASIVAQLETLHAEYKIDDKSGLVLVREDTKDRLRMQLMERGVPLRASVGFELFDNSDFGMTEFTQKINYQRALEGELERTVMTLDGVRYARVHLVLPESTLFKRDREQPKASVTLMLTQQRQLDPDQVAGIRRLVASAVPGLSTDMVTVHDHRGVDLARPNADGGSAQVAEQRLQAEERIEAYLAGKVYEMLSQVFPRDSIAVSVDATLRMDHTTSTREQVLPSARSGGFITHLKSTTTGKTGAADVLQKAEEGDLPAPTSNNPSHVQLEVAYELGKLTEQTEFMPGQIERLSVGVIVPDLAAFDTTVARVSEIVSAAVGAESARGDRVAVYTVSDAVESSRRSKPSALLTPSESIGRSIQPVSAAPAASAIAQWVIIAAAGAFLLLVVAFSLVRSSDRALSEEERAELLAKVKRWLEEGGASR